MDTTNPTEQEFPLTDIQEAYIVGRSRVIELGGRQQYYVEFEAVDFDPARAEEAINRLVLRHEPLRTVMLENGNQRVMAASDIPPFQVAAADVTGLSPDGQNAEIQRTRERMCDEGLDPMGWPLFELAVTRLRRYRLRIHLRASLILLDAPSLRTVVTEWDKLYHDPDTALPPVSQTFRDWRMSLLARENSDSHHKHWRYWEERLDSLPEAPQLPLARQPESIESVGFKGRTAYLNGDQWRQFCANFRKHRVLPTTALLHVLAETLGAWASTPHFCLNVVHLNLAARDGDMQEVVGQRTATLPLEVDLRGDQDFWTRAQQLQRRLWKDMANSEVTGVQISRELAARHGWTQRAALPYVFTSNQGPGWDSMRPPSRPAFRFLGRIQHTPHVLMDDQIRDTPDGGIASNLDFVDEAFPPNLPDAIAEQYRHILETLARPDGTDVQPALAQGPHRELISDINDTACPPPAGRLEDGFLHQAGTRADATAILTSQRTVTYGELEATSRAVAEWLHDQGVGRGDVVPVVMLKGWEQVVAVLGALRVGAAYCPIDAGMPTQPMWDLLDSCSARVVLKQSHSMPDMAPWRIPTLDVDQIQPSTNPLLATETDSADLAYVIYTSGSTGPAKGVMVEHRAALNTVSDINQRIALDAGDRVFGISSLSFDLSVWDIFGTLSVGAALVLPDATPRPDPIEWAATVLSHGVTVWNSVPALTEMLIEIAEQRPEMGRPPIRAFMVSGDWIPTSLPRRMRQLWPDVRVIGMGGATEASIWSNIYEIDEVDPAWHSIPYGTPLRNQTMTVLDHRLNVRPPWAVGHIYIGGVGLARGYLHDEERTAERFIHHPHTGERLYRTGDLGRYWPDGNIEFIGRDDRQVKILGFRVEPGAVEAAINSHTGVHECLVCVDNAPGGQRRLVSLVVPEQDDQIDSDVIADYLRFQLPYYMIPGQIRIVDQLPLTPNGKVDTSRALAMFAITEAAPSDGAENSPLTKHLGELWAELLQVPAVDPDDNFFTLGGNSLLALRMVNRVRAELGAEVPFGQVFEAPTTRKLASRIAQGNRRTSSLVELSSGTGGEDLFLFHVLGGSVAPYIPLAEAWAGPVWAFQARSLVESTDAAFAPDLETMAATYLQELLRHKPEGPYILGGWSMGGSLAFEVARQLSEQDRRAYVFMIDSDISSHYMPDNEVDRHHTFLVSLTLKPTPESAVTALHAATPDELVRVARDEAVAHGMLPPEVDVPGYDRLMRVHQHELAIVRTWQPPKLHQPTLLFAAADEVDRPDQSPLWRAACPDIDIEDTPGDHYTIGEQLPHIAKRVAAWVEEKRDIQAVRSEN